MRSWDAGEIAMKIGFVSLPLSGHLNPMTALARKLQSRGHDITYIGVPDAEPIVRAAGVNFVPYCEKEFPKGTIAKDWGHVAKMHGQGIVAYTIETLEPALLKPALEQLPAKIKETGVQAMVLDIVHFFVEIVPMSLGIPYVQIWNVLNIDLSGATPPSLFGGQNENTPEALARNVEKVKWINGLMGPVADLAIPYAEKMGLKVDWSDPAATSSKLAIISQIPKEFDFPNIPWPPQFHYAGPFHDGAGREQQTFPWERLDGRPLIYASLGTLVNGLDYIYKIILDAVGTLSNVQVVLSVGKNVNRDDLGQIPSNTIVVNSAPQLELLQRATLCITHAGLNTTFESLAQGVPMVAIPIGYEQPGVAARIVYHGAGELIEVEDLTVVRLSELIPRVQTNPGYRDRARDFQKVIAKTHGLDKAAEIVEKVFENHQTANLPEKQPALSRV
jgi:zeaxanthin glucosyltransferase